jgi:hypothetical protein
VIPEQQFQVAVKYISIRSRDVSIVAIGQKSTRSTPVVPPTASSDQEVVGHGWAASSEVSWWKTAPP